MSFRTLLRLRSAALQPAAGRTLKPLKPTAANATVPSTIATAPHKLLLRRISYSSAYTSPLPAAARSFLGAGHGSSSTKKTTEPAKKGEDDAVVIVEGGGIRGRRCPPGTRCVAPCSKACQIYGDIYACVLVLSWMVRRIIVLAARDGREWLRRYVREKFSRKR